MTTTTIILTHIMHIQKSLGSHAANCSFRRDPFLIHMRHAERRPRTPCCTPSVKYVIIGGISLLYGILEIVVALYMNSLSLMGDGFHTLGDVWALYIAFYCETVRGSSLRRFPRCTMLVLTFTHRFKAKKRPPTSRYSYGWARLEVLGTRAGYWLIILVFLRMASSHPVCTNRWAR